MTAQQRNPLIEAWRGFSPSSEGCHILDVDRVYFKNIGYFEGREHLLEPLTFESYVASDRFRIEKGFHFSLLPIPFAGNLADADIYILMLNPGFHDADYYAEFENAGFRESSLRSLQQHFRDDDFYFHYLNPSYCWHPGYSYWINKFGKLADQLAKSYWDGNLRCALFELSRRIAVVELIPYHSRSYNDGNLTANLPSAQLSKQWAHDLLVPKIMQKKAVAVVTRQASIWGLDELADSIVCYSKGEARGAHLTPNSRGGKLLLERLLTYRGNGFAMKDCSQGATLG